MRATRKAVAMFLTLAIAVSFGSVFPVQAAGSAAVWDGTVDISWYDPAQSEYYIGTPAQLAGLAALVNGMADPTCPEIIGDQSYLKSIVNEDTQLVGSGGGSVSDITYGSEIDFAYKTVYLTADLDMGGVYTNGVWSGPNWTPIGGKYPMKPSVTDGDCYVLDTRFCGVLDGQGHTISHVYCDRYAAKGFPYSQAVGLVGYLGGTMDTEENPTFEGANGWQPTVRNIVLGEGYIYGRRMVGGIVGRVAKASNGVVIENCANYADIHNTDAKGVGGIVGAGWGTGVIRNCYNVGSVTTTYACPAGGICGNNMGMDIYNCYNVGTIDSNGNQRAVAIGGHDSGTYTIGNCYYLEGCDDDPDSNGWYKGTSKTITVDTTCLTSDEMKTVDLVGNLNASGTVFVQDSGNINQGYPVLWFQAGAYGTESYSVSVQQPAEGGSVTADFTGTVANMETVTLSAQEAGGWKLAYYTLNGQAIDTDFFVVSENSTVSAVFSKVNQVQISLPQSDDSYLSFSKTGYEMSGDEMVYVTNKPIHDGDTVLEGNVISVNAIPHEGAVPADQSLSYSGAYNIRVTNAVVSAIGTFMVNGTFTVTGEGDIEVTIDRSTTQKSWASYADTSWYLGDRESYTLTTPEQLAGMAYLVNTEGVSFQGTTICLGNDISLASADGRIWTACGNSSNQFAGVFDGCGYTIYDMSAYSQWSYTGLFGYCDGATLQNINVRGTVVCDASTSYAAGVVANASGCVIENCVNRAEVTANGTGAAGIAAYICNGTTVSGCTNYAGVSGTSGVGGIVGICYSVEDVISGCDNYGEIQAAGDESYGTGGIVGQLPGSVEDCGNFAAVTSADRYTGGIAGYTTSRFQSTITNSISTGAVTSNCKNLWAGVGSAVGYAQYLTMENVSATGSVSTGADFTATSKGGLTGREGTVTEQGTANPSLLPASTVDTDTWTQPAAKQAPWTVTFLADGQTIDTQTYSSAGERISEPAVPAKDGYTAQWGEYTLGGGDLTVQAVYYPIVVHGGDAVTESGTYFLDYSTSGEVSIADGLTVTLKGMGAACDELTLRAGTDVSLALEDVALNGTQSLLTLNGGTLELKGENTLVSTCDEKGNLHPTVWVCGSETFTGTGSLYVESNIGNAAVKLDTGAVLEQQSGTLSLVKLGQLSIEGGALFANEGTVILSGGTFNGCTNSDNVSVISAQELKITGGTVRAQATASPTVLDGGTVSITGGTLYCQGHTGNSHSFVRKYSGVEAISGLSGSAACTFAQALPFSDVFVTDMYFEDVAGVYHAGYFSGTSDTAFSPDTGMTRAMFVTVLYRMAGAPSVSAQTPFTDLTQDWYRDAVAWAVEYGITSGTSETTFSPDVDVTLEQAAVFLVHYLETKGGAAVPMSGDAGAGSSSWARAAVAWAVENGMLPANADFSQSATRALLATAIMAFDSM
ncbi:MAG: S-layer homology domain-containing protein [Oscillospiraceae bacterium]|nr:S-layer homology domain-containing protein [Oscillospiraceae bacterium]